MVKKNSRSNKKNAFGVDLSDYDKLAQDHEEYLQKHGPEYVKEYDKINESFQKFIENSNEGEDLSGIIFPLN